jgi:hypothetical protein
VRQGALVLVSRSTLILASSKIFNMLSFYLASLFGTHSYFHRYAWSVFSIIVFLVVSARSCKRKKLWVDYFHILHGSMLHMM